ncbi:MAG: cardiolipin synthase [Microlunatus sp.]
MRWLADSLGGAGLLGAMLGLFVLVALLVAPRSKRPSSALAWILVITFLPGLGLILFAVIGSPRLPAVRCQRQQNMDELFNQRGRAVADPSGRPGGPSWLPSVARLNRRLGAMPLLDGNSARLIADFENQLAALVNAVEQAESYVHVEFFILSYDDRTAVFFEALGRAADRGVVVRVLLDHLGSRRYPGYRRALAALDTHQISWQLMLPVQPLRLRYQRPDLRNHRKLLVVDGTVAFVGSMNLIEPGYQQSGNHRRGLEWRDLMCEFEGTVVRAVDAVFATDWYSETDEVLDGERPLPTGPPPGDLQAQLAPSGPAFRTENNLALFNSLMYYAENRISITSPYFVPDESLLGAITTAARRGVAVELFVSEAADQFLVFHAQHSYYSDLLEAGVRIYLYPAPAILHAKHISIDDQVAVIGSSNMDIRSFQLDLELMVLVSGPSFVQQMRAVEDGYRAVSRELTVDTWASRTRRHKLVDDLSRLTSAVQ